MIQFDVFNGDADGICALHQLRLAAPCPNAELITGPKREINLLKRVETSAGDTLTVLDISLDSNRVDLERILASGAAVRYFDHHYAGEKALTHPRLSAHINTAPEVCTSLLVDAWLDGRYRLWAIAAAFGDNLHKSARKTAESLALDEITLSSLQALGECLNYNGYGESLADLRFHPAELYLAVRPYEDPRRFIAESPAYRKLHEGYRADLRSAHELSALLDTATVAAFELPDAAWARRVSGTLANQLAHEHPERAHAVLTPASNNTYTVSVRAPLNRPIDAGSLCRQFPNGGGRAAAAGINGLPASEVPILLKKLSAHFG
jgi:hypothetical protein